MNWMGAVCLGASIAALPGMAHGLEDRFAAGAGLGTTGAEAQVAYLAHEKLVLRGSFSVLDHDVEIDSQDVTYTGDLATSVGGIFIDYRPMANWFAITGGLVFGDRTLDIRATPSAPVDIGGVTYSPAEIGALAGEVDMGAAAPYLGVTADTTFGARGRVGVRAAAGVILGAVDVTLRSTGGLLSTSPTLAADIQREEARIEDEAEALAAYPVISVSAFTRF